MATLHKMKNVLITGATGNVGVEVIKALSQRHHQLNIIAGVRDVKEDVTKLIGNGIYTQQFDFTNVACFDAALDNCDILFLLRPPQVSAVEEYFKPLIKVAVEKGIQHIVFLSVQGVQDSKIIPHHKIEKLIVESKIPYIFLRPAYFMQNFTTTLRSDLVNKKSIFLPAGNARFTLIDVRDIGAVAAEILINPQEYINKAYDLTSNQKLTFRQMARKLSKGLGASIQFKSPTLLHFFLAKRKEKMPYILILVMIMLHYLPRFKKEPVITNWVQKITGRQPITFDQFIADHNTLLLFPAKEITGKEP